MRWKTCRGTGGLWVSCNGGFSVSPRWNQAPLSRSLVHLGCGQVPSCGIASVPPRPPPFGIHEPVVDISGYEEEDGDADC